MSIWPRVHKITVATKNFFKSSRFKAILLSLALFFIGVALVFGIFFGGRWLYRRIFNNTADNPVPAEAPASSEVEQSGDDLSNIENSVEPDVQNSTSVSNNQAENIINTGPEPE